MRHGGYEAVPVGLALGLLLLTAAGLVPARLSAQSGCLPAPDGLVGWWPGDGDAEDIQGGNHGVPQNGAAFDAGFVGSAFDFDGYDDLVLVPDDPSLNFGLGDDFTIDAWVYLTNPVASHDDEIVFKVKHSPSGFSDGYRLSIQRGSRKLFLGVTTDEGQTGIDLYSESPVPLDQWTHVAAVRAGSQWSLYLNGLPDATDEVTDGSLANDWPLSIGGLYDTRFSPPVQLHHVFAGRIDELEIFDRALGDEEIWAIYSAGSAGKCKDEDGDGFRPPADCDETDPQINPDAVELPGNFVDENCDGNLGECDPCFPWRNHGEYVRCVAHAVESLVLGGILSEEEGDILVSSAASSDIGKRGFAPPQCP